MGPQDVEADRHDDVTMTESAIETAVTGLEAMVVEVLGGRRNAEIITTSEMEERRD
jgi:hypothetical protein